MLTEDVGAGGDPDTGWGDLDLRNNVFTNAASASGGYFWLRDDPGQTLTFEENLLTGNDISNGLRVRAIQRTTPDADPLEVDISSNVWEDNAAFAMNVNNVVGTIADNEVPRRG